MLGVTVGLNVQQGGTTWFDSARYVAPNAAGGPDLGPAAILDFVRGQYAATPLDPGQISSASAVDLSSLTEAAFEDAVNFSRASSAWAFSAQGSIVNSAANMPRLQFWAGGSGFLTEPESVNHFRNSKFENAVVGGTCPDTALYGAGNVAVTIAGKGTEFGLPYVDLRYLGVADTGTFYVRFIPVATPVASAGQHWTLSSYIRRISGVLPAEFEMFMQERSSGGYNGGSSLPLDQVGDDLGRASLSYEVTNATSNEIWSGFRVVTKSAKNYDFVVRLYAPQLEQQQYASSPILTGQGAIATRAADICQLSAKLESLMRRQQSTVVLKYRPLAGSDNRDAERYLLAGSNTGNSRYAILASSPTSGVAPTGIVGNGSSFSSLRNSTGLDAETSARLALSVTPTQSFLSVNGIMSLDNPGVGFDAASNAATSFYLGAGPGGADGEMLHLEEVLIYPFEIDPAYLSNLTG